MSPNILGLYVGAVASLIFLAFSYFSYKKVPALSQVAVVLLAWAGAIVGVHLGYFALTADDIALGNLADQRISIFLGALAVVWTAAESFFTSLKAVKP